MLRNDSSSAYPHEFGQAGRERMSRIEQVPSDTAIVRIVNFEEIATSTNALEITVMGMVLRFSPTTIDRMFDNPDMTRKQWDQAIFTSITSGRDKYKESRLKSFRVLHAILHKLLHNRYFIILMHADQNATFTIPIYKEQS